MRSDCDTNNDENLRFNEFVTNALERMCEAISNPPSYEVIRSQSMITVRKLPPCISFCNLL